MLKHQVCEARFVIPSLKISVFRENLSGVDLMNYVVEWCYQAWLFELCVDPRDFFRPWFPLQHTASFK